MQAVPLFLRSRAFVAIASLLSIILFDWLFYGHTIGWTVGLFVAVAAVLIVLHTPQALQRTAVRCCAVALAGLIVALIIDPTALSILLTAIALAAWSFLMKNPWVAGVRVVLWRAFHFVPNTFARTLRDSLVASRWFRKHPARRPAAHRLLVRWIIPCLLGIIFITLFIIANPIIENWAARFASQLCELLAAWRDYLIPSRIALWFAVLLVTWSLLRPWRVRWLQQVRIPPRQHPHPARAAAAVVRCLALFNLIFAVPTTLDLIYLWAGRTLPNHLTYAQYAHHGAYPLVATALFAALFVLITFRHHGPAEKSRTARAFVYLWIAQNVMLMVSTLWRLKLYVDVYSLTRLRVATMIWIALVAFGFLWIVWRILRTRTNTWLLYRNIITAAAVLYGCTFINFDRLIADFNVRHCREVAGAGAPLDVDYLRSLGPDSIPALHYAADHLPPPAAAESYQAAEDLTLELQQDLADWRGWTIRRWRVASISLPPLPTPNP